MTEQTVLHLYGEVIIHGEDGSTTTIRGGHLEVSGPGEYGGTVSLRGLDREAEVMLRSHDTVLDEGTVLGINVQSDDPNEGTDAEATIYARSAKGDMGEIVRLGGAS